VFLASRKQQDIPAKAEAIRHLVELAEGEGK
jgi:hypothetical protein